MTDDDKTEENAVQEPKEPTANEAPAKVGSGFPIGLVIVFAVALLIGFAAANPSAIGKLLNSGYASCHGIIATASNSSSATSSSFVAAANSTAALSNKTESSSAEDANVQVINMTVDRYGYSPNSFVLKKGVKTRWVINAKELTGCNKEIKVPDYSLTIKLQAGENEVEFTPEKTGVVRWSCWMGMIQGSFTVVEDPGNQTQINNAVASAPPVKKSGGCGCGGGGTCGG